MAGNNFRKDPCHHPLIFRSRRERPVYFILIAYVNRHCVSCEKLFTICSSCFRGQKYCGSKCRVSARRRRARARSLRYQQTSKGRLHHRARQVRYRKRLNSKTSANIKTVTHATSNFTSKVGNPSLHGLVCWFCGCSVSLSMQESHKPATDLRRIKGRKGFDINRARGKN